MVEEGELTDLARRASKGDDAAAEALLALAYDDLCRIARARLRRGSRDIMLDTIALISEWYLRFARAHQLQLRDRSHFLSHAAAVMRSIIVDYARRNLSGKRGKDAAHIPLSLQIADTVTLGAEEILAVHEALESIARSDPRLARVVEMRYFAGMNEVETAEALELSPRTVRRDWLRARLLLTEALGR